MEDLESEWQRKGATLSDKTARQEYDLTQDEILEAINKGELQYRIGSVYGNPFFRLLRREVETLLRKSRGKAHLTHLQAKTELTRINRELKRLQAQITALNKLKLEVTARIGDSTVR